jgi:pyruvate dehydrogenase E1 component alpha subunit
MAQAKPKESTPSREHAHELLRQMLMIRRFEEKAAELYQLGKIRGFLHLYIGEEAVGVGAMHALAPEDSVITTYRDHGHALARGLSAQSLVAEMYGKSTGCSRGRGGSMHFFDVSRRFYGGYAIVGGGLPIAAGIALAQKMRGEPNITACFFGDGAVAEGEFHETMNLAALWKLPILFLCENNLYAMGTALNVTLSETDITRKAKGYRIPSLAVDGMDVLAVEDAARQAAAEVRNLQGPRLLELRTYRFRGHSMADPELYREKGEVEEWKKRDPILSFQRWLLDRELLSDEDLQSIEAGIAAEIDDAVNFAEESPWEPVEDVTKDVSTE